MVHAVCLLGCWVHVVCLLGRWVHVCVFAWVLCACLCVCLGVWVLCACCVHVVCLLVAVCMLSVCLCVLAGCPFVCLFGAVCLLGGVFGVVYVFLFVLCAGRVVCCAQSRALGGWYCVNKPPKVCWAARNPSVMYDVPHQTVSPPPPSPFHTPLLLHAGTRRYASEHRRPVLSTRRSCPRYGPAPPLPPT